MITSEPSKIWREVIGLWLMALALILAFKLLSFVPFIRENLWGIAGLVFLFGPLEYLRYKREDPVRYGITRRHLGKGLLWVALLVLLSFPAYAPAFKWWFGRGEFVFAIPADFWKEVVGFFLLVALPEEVFYRGYMQTRLDVIFTRRVRVLGAEVGWSLVITAAFFAVGHLIEPRLDKLGTFFPGLVFGWLRARTGSIGGAVVFHALCNIYAQVLYFGYFGVPADRM